MTARTLVHFLDYRDGRTHLAAWTRMYEVTVEALPNLLGPYGHYLISSAAAPQDGPMSSE